MSFSTVVGQMHAILSISNILSTSFCPLSLADISFSLAYLVSGHIFSAIAEIDTEKHMRVWVLHSTGWHLDLQIFLPRGAYLISVLQKTAVFYIEAILSEATHSCFNSI